MKLMSVYLSKLYQVQLGSLYSAAHGVFFFPATFYPTISLFFSSRARPGLHSYCYMGYRIKTHTLAMKPLMLIKTKGQGIRLLFLFHVIRVSHCPQSCCGQSSYLSQLWEALPHRGSIVLSNKIPTSGVF